MGSGARAAVALLCVAAVALCAAQQPHVDSAAAISSDDPSDTFGAIRRPQESVVWLGPLYDPARRSEFSPERVLSWYLSGNYTAVNDFFVDMWRYFDENTFTSFPGVLSAYIDRFVMLFSQVFVSKSFPVRSHLAKYLAVNDVIANVFFLSQYRTTDALLNMLLAETPADADKVAVLFNPRCEANVSYSDLRAIIPEFFGDWYASWYALAFSGLAERHVMQRLYEHQRYLLGVVPTPPLFADLHHVLQVYFACTYIDERSEPAAHQHVHAAVHASIRRFGYAIRSTPNPRSVAVITGHWGADKTIVHRVYYRYLVEMSHHFDLTLVQINIHLHNQIREPPPGSIFNRMLFVNMHADSSLDLSEIQENDFALAVFLDIGMTLQSLILSQLRVAPIQVTGHGHPISTFGGEIDYFIGSAEAEAAHLVEGQYSERVVLVPGLGVVHSDFWSAFAVTRPVNYSALAVFAPSGVLQRPAEPDAVIINCPWHGQKINFRLVQALQQIIAQSPRHLVLRFFLGGGLSSRQRFLPMVSALHRELSGATVQAFYGGIPASDYLGLLEEGAFFLDAYPFGGVNTVIDALHLGKPFVCLQGTRWINRVAAAHMRRAGTPELIANSFDEYVTLALRLIREPPFLAELQRRLARLDMRALFYEDGSEVHLASALQLLIGNHDKFVAAGDRYPLLFRP